MTPRALPDPHSPALSLLFVVVSVAAFFAMGAAVAAYLFDRLVKEHQ